MVAGVDRNESTSNETVYGAKGPSGGFLRNWTGEEQARFRATWPNSSVLGCEQNGVFLS